MPGGVGIVVPEPLTSAAMADEAAAKARADPASLVAKRLKHVTPRGGRDSVCAVS